MLLAVGIVALIVGVVLLGLLLWAIVPEDGVFIPLETKRHYKKRTGQQ